MKMNTKRWVALLIGFTVLLPVVTYAMTVTLLPTLHISLFSSQITSSEFSITTSGMNINGPNKITVKLTLTNTDTTNSHSADVTVELLNASSDQITNSTQNTGTVSASQSVSLSFVFKAPNIASETTNYFVVVSDTS